MDRVQKNPSDFLTQEPSSRETELKNKIEETQKIIDKHSFEYCDMENNKKDGDCEWDEIWTCMTGYNARIQLSKLKAELKGIQEGIKIGEARKRDEIREWLIRLSNMGVIQHPVGFEKMFDKEFGDRNDRQNIR